MREQRGGWRKKIRGNREEEEDSRVDCSLFSSLFPPRSERTGRRMEKDLRYRWSGNLEKIGGMG